MIFKELLWKTSTFSIFFRYYLLCQKFRRPRNQGMFYHNIVLHFCKKVNDLTNALWNVLVRNASMSRDAKQFQSFGSGHKRSSARFRFCHESSVQASSRCRPAGARKQNSGKKVLSYDWEPKITRKSSIELIFSNFELKLKCVSVTIRCKQFQILNFFNTSPIIFHELVECRPDNPDGYFFAQRAV